jgi:hypothetical protein
MEKYTVDLLSNLDSHIKDIGDWEESNGHYIYNILEQVTPDDVMRNVEHSGFWKKYAATIDSGTKAPPTRRTCQSEQTPSKTALNVHQL